MRVLAQLVLAPPSPARRLLGRAHPGEQRQEQQIVDRLAAERHGRQSLHLARQYGPAIDRFVICEVFLARLTLARGDVTGAAAMLAEAGRSARERNFVQRVPEVAAVQVLTLLRQRELAAAARLAEAHDLPLSRARVHLARGDASAALAALEPVRRRAEAKGREDERLPVLVLQALAHHAQGDEDRAVHALADALALAEPGGFIRLFVDEGPPMARLLDAARATGGDSAYVHRLLAAFPGAASEQTTALPLRGPASAVVEPLSAREREVLRLIAAGLSNQEVATRLYLSPHTVKVHARNIYAKLGVTSRMQAAATGKALGLVPETPPPR